MEQREAESSREEVLQLNEKNQNGDMKGPVLPLALLSRATRAPAGTCVDTAATLSMQWQ